MIDQVFDFVRENYAGLALATMAVGLLANGLYHRRQEKSLQRLLEFQFSEMTGEQRKELMGHFRREGLDSAADLVSMASSYQITE